MKRMILICLSFLVLMAVPTLMMAQVVAPVASDVPAFNLLIFDTYFGSLTGMAGIILPLAAILNKQLKIVKPWPKRLISWFVGVGLGYLAMLIKLGIFTGLDWYLALGYGLLAALLANGVFSIDFVKMLLRLAKLEVKVD